MYDYPRFTETGVWRGGIYWNSDRHTNGVMFPNPVCWHRPLSSLGNTSGYTIILFHQRGKAPQEHFPGETVNNNKVPKIKARRTHSILRVLCSNIFPSLKNTSLPSCVCKVLMPAVLWGTVNKAGKERAEAKFRDLPSCDAPSHFRGNDTGCLSGRKRWEAWLSRLLHFTRASQSTREI